MSAILGVFKQFIRGTEKKAPVKQLTVVICNLTNIVKQAIDFPTIRVYATTNVLKHLYDKRTAQEMDFLLENIPKIIKNPLKIYKNRDEKVDSFCFCKEFGNDVYFCIVEKKEEADPNNGDIGMNYLVSAYKLSEDTDKRERYIAGYKLLWSWEGDIPPS